jgi:GNAT superfamily N-acetyltransferase
LLDSSAQSSHQIPQYVSATQPNSLLGEPAVAHMSINFELATNSDASASAALHTSVADELTQKHGRGPWSTKTSEKGVLLALRTCRVFVVRQGAEIIGTFRLTTKKPWAIDTSHFTKCNQPVYLLAMAVAPSKQRQGLGRRYFDEAKRIAQAWPADAIRFDAYDAAAGAGDFYARCGCQEVGRASYRNTPLVYFEFCFRRQVHLRLSISSAAERLWGGRSTQFP